MKDSVCGFINQTSPSRQPPLRTSTTASRNHCGMYSAIMSARFYTFSIYLFPSRNGYRMIICNSDFLFREPPVPGWRLSGLSAQSRYRLCMLYIVQCVLVMCVCGILADRIYDVDTKQWLFSPFFPGFGFSFSFILGTLHAVSPTEPGVNYNILQMPLSISYCTDIHMT